jgi:hypothetical protein
VEFEQKYFAFSSEHSLATFRAQPKAILEGIKQKVMNQPEYIHLLDLQDQFPNSSIQNLLKRVQSLNKNSSNPMFASSGWVDGEEEGDGEEEKEERTKDACVSTPLHFQERNIDPNYHWNEWELRRKALKVVKLRHSATTASQTDESHFKRTVETQVYVPKDNTTQTRRDQGTNPPRVISYVTGLRGSVSLPPLVTSGETNSSKRVEASNLARPETQVRSALVQLSIDL